MYILKHILAIISIPTEHWITRSLFYWMNQISSAKANRKTLDMLVKDTSVNQIPYIVMVSTPNNPGGLFYQIEKKPEETCLYKRLKMDYHYGLGKIYTLEEIDKANLSPGFDREYGLQYLGKVGNVFSEVQILKAIELGDKYSLAKIPINNLTIHSIGVDIGFGRSSTSVVATEFLKEQSKIRVVYAQEWEHGDPQAIVNLIFNLCLQYGTDNTFIWVDGSNRAFCNLLKVAFSESLNWEKGVI